MGEWAGVGNERNSQRNKAEKELEDETAKLKVILARHQGNSTLARNSLPPDSLCCLLKIQRSRKDNGEV